MNARAMPRIEAILFDADGVIQRPTVDYRDVCRQQLGLTPADVDRFMSEVFAVERPSLTGGDTFHAALSALLARWQLSHRQGDALAIWTALETDPAMRDAIVALRAAGIVCCLATNQQEHRRAFMSRELGYGVLFDREFYSCGLGFAKPDPRYFRAIAEQLTLPPDRLLFIDDHAPNVQAAREVGLHAALFTADFTTSAGVLRALLAEHGIELP
jgi:putative hydrolase of the HAD superfamily